jgi:hypothetical protein
VRRDWVESAISRPRWAGKTPNTEHALPRTQSMLILWIADRCIARTRSGQPCQAPAMLNGRCRMHGGNSPGGSLPGNSGLPGRPKGARNKLAEAMIEDLYADWKEHGIQAIREVRETRPANYLKIVAMVVSKCVDLSMDDEMRDAAVEQFIEERRQQALLMIEKMREAQ